jgi:hypothetical protein
MTSGRSARSGGPGLDPSRKSISPTGRHPRPHRCDEILPFNGQQFAAGVDRNGVGGTRVAIEESNFAKDVAFAEEIEDGNLTVRRWNADFHCSRYNGEQTGAWITLKRIPIILKHSLDA